MSANATARTTRQSAPKKPHGKRAPKQPAPRKQPVTPEAVYSMEDLWLTLQAGCFSHGFTGVTEHQFEAALRTLAG